jgi:hypothetical protein
MSIAARYSLFAHGALTSAANVGGYRCASCRDCSSSPLWARRRRCKRHQALGQIAEGTGQKKLGNHGDERYRMK